MYYFLICLQNELFLLLADFPKLSQSFLTKKKKKTKKHSFLVGEDQVNLYERQQVSFELLCLLEEQSTELHQTPSTTKMAGRIGTGIVINILITK